jgi:hypothetical protein
MNQPPPTIDDIGNARDTPLVALDSVLDDIEDEISQTTKKDAHLAELTKQKEALQAKYKAVSDAATEAVLALPEVIAAASTLKKLSTDIDAKARQLPSTTTNLDKAAAILSLGQQFRDVIANARKS